MRYLLILLTVSLVACSTPRASGTTSSQPTEAPAAAEPSYTGAWDITVMDTPAGTVKGTLTLTESTEGLGGTINVNGSDVNLREVKRTEEGLLINFYSSDYQTDVDMRLNGEPSSDELTGLALNSFMTVATRQK